MKKNTVNHLRHFLDEPLHADGTIKKNIDTADPIEVVGNSRISSVCENRRNGIKRIVDNEIKNECARGFLWIALCGFIYGHACGVHDERTRRRKGGDKV